MSLEKTATINDYALKTDQLHPYYKIYNNHMFDLLKNTKHMINFKDLVNIGKNNVYKVVFNSNDVHDDVFEIFRQANNTKVFYDNEFGVDKKVYNYKKTLEKFINNPQKESLIELCVKSSNNKDDIYHQIPHFIFPIFGLFLTTTPRLLILLCNHPNILNKVIKEVNNNEVSNLQLFTKMYYGNSTIKCTCYFTF